MIKTRGYQRKRQLTVNQRKVLEVIANHQTGIYQTVLSEQSGVEMCTVRYIVNSFARLEILTKESAGNGCRITPRNIEAIQQLLKNGNGKGNGDGDHHSNVPRSDLVQALPEFEDQPLEDSPETKLTIDHAITLVPELEWEIGCVDETGGEEQRPDNWTYEVDSLSTRIWDQKVQNGTVILDKCLMKKKRVSLQTLYNYCSISPGDLDNFLIMLAVLINDKNAQKIKE